MRRFEVQEKLWKDDDAILAIASAFIRMPLAKSFSIGSYTRMGRHRWFRETDESSIYKVMTREMLVPLEGRGSSEVHLEDRPTEWLFKLPVAICKVETSLTTFDFDIRTTLNPSAVFLTDENIQTLTAGMQKLHKFNFRMGDWEWEWRLRQADLTHLVKFFNAILDTESIVKLSVDFKDALSLIQVKQWPRLSELEVESARIRISELQKLVDKRSAKLPMLCLKYASLASDSEKWADVIDMLRGNLVNVRFDHARFNMLDNLYTDDDDYDFDSFVSPEEKMAEYIRGEIDHNPLRDPPSQDTDSANGMEKEDNEEEKAN